MLKRTILAMSIAAMLVVAAEGQNGQGGGNGNANGHANKQRDAERFRARAARRANAAGGGEGRYVGPQLDGKNAQPKRVGHDRHEHRSDIKEARRRAGIEPKDREPHDRRKQAHEGAAKDAELIDRPHPHHDHEHHARRRFRQQLADIDRMRDAAIESGDLNGLARADALEAELRREVLDSHFPNGRGPTGEGPPGWLRRGEFPPGQDPNRLPPGHDPNRLPPGRDPNRVPPGLDRNPPPPGLDPSVLPPGIDPNHLPPGLERAMQQRFHGRLLHQGNLPPGQVGKQPGLPGKLAPLPPPPVAPPGFAPLEPGPTTPAVDPVPVP
jgi:hypothetical protein